MNNAAFPILDEINRLKADIDTFHPLDPEMEQRVMDRFRLEWNYHSNAIEGNTLSLGETKAFLLEGITAQGKPFKDYLDIEGHDAAIDYLLDFLRNEGPLTEVDIRRLHEILLVKSYDITAKKPDGRMTRLLTNLHLMKHGYPPIIIQKEDRGAYYLALAEADEGNPENIVNLIGSRLASSMELYLRGAHR